MATSTPQIDPVQLNLLQRQAVLNSSIEMTQVLQTVTIDPTKIQTVTIQPRNVGLVKKFIVEITGTVSNTDAALDATLTDLGLANILSNVQFTDLNNNQRINTSGWHLSFLNSVKRRGPFASGFALETDTMGGFGENYPVISAPATVAHGATQNFRAVYEVPVAFSNQDLRGAILANVSGVNMQLAMTINPRPFVAAGTDSTLAVYKGTASGAFTTLTFNVSQVYLDQLPMGPTGLIVPTQDISTVYELKLSPFQSIAAAQDYSVLYAAFREFQSTFAIYNHDTSVDTGRVAGTDINYWALQSANYTNIWKKNPLLVAQQTRSLIGCDLPKGCYYFDYRDKPLNSIQYGNMDLVLNPSTAGVNAQLLIGWEDFANQTLLPNAGSLA